MKTKIKNKLTNNKSSNSPMAAESSSFVRGSVKDLEILFSGSSKDSETSVEPEFQSFNCPFSCLSLELKPYLTALDLRSLIEATIEDNITPYDFYKTAADLIKSLQNPEQKISLDEISFYDLCVLLYDYKILTSLDPEHITITLPNGEEIAFNLREIRQRFDNLPSEQIDPIEIETESSNKTPVVFTFHHPLVKDQILYYKTLNARFASRIPELKAALKKEGSLISLFSASKTESTAAAAANKELLRTILNISLFLDLARTLKKVTIYHSKINPDMSNITIEAQTLSLDSREKLLEKLDGKTITLLTTQVSSYIKKIENLFTTEEGIDILPHQKLFTN